MKKFVFTVAALMSLGYSYAQDNSTPMAELIPAQRIEPAQKVEEKIEIKPAGRILIDGGVFGANHYHDQFVSGVAMPDFRAGLGARYGQWKAKIDIGYAYNALSVKDVLIEYGFSKHTLLRGGVFCTSIRYAKCNEFFFQDIYGRTSEQRSLFQWQACRAYADAPKR